MSEIRAWSTELARGFYERLGFTLVRDLYLPEDTRDVGLIEMVKTL